MDCRMWRSYNGDANSSKSYLAKLQQVSGCVLNKTGQDIVAESNKAAMVMANYKQDKNFNMVMRYFFSLDEFGLNYFELVSSKYTD